MATKTKYIDMAGLTPIVDGIRVGATKPGQLGSELTGTEIQYLDAITPGTAAASKALVLNSSAGITTGLTSLTATTVTPTTIAGAANFTGTPTFAAGITVTGGITATTSIAATTTLSAGTTLTVTGATTHTGAVIMTPDVISAAGAVSVVTPSTRINSSGAIALTLADGTNGQIKTLCMGTDGGDATLTPATKTGYTTIVFNDVGDGCTLQFFTTIGWIVIGTFGATIS